MLLAEELELEVEQSPAQLLAWLPMEMLADLVGQLEEKEKVRVESYPEYGLPCGRTDRERAPSQSPAS